MHLGHVKCFSATKLHQKSKFRDFDPFWALFDLVGTPYISTLICIWDGFSPNFKFIACLDKKP